MKDRLRTCYEAIVLDRPRAALAVLLAVIIGFASQAHHFRLDASADALVLENDADLKFFRDTNRRYGVDEFLALTWTPGSELFSHESLAKLRDLKRSLGEADGVQEVLSILDLPLADSPRIKLAGEPRTLAMPDTDLSLARREFLTSPLYKDLFLSADAKTTMLLVYLKGDPHYDALLQQREALRTQKHAGQLDQNGLGELERISAEFRDYHSVFSGNQQRIIKDIRDVMNHYRDDAGVFLGGAPMIVSDMLDMIENDLVVFGTAVMLFLILVLTVIFRSVRWVALPILCCSVTVLAMIGLLGLLDWHVTVVSSNFVALLLIITMSMTIHLCVRFRESQAINPDTPTRELLSQTMRFMFKPCIYTSLTTIVAFASLVVSNIRPVIDFGHIMTLGIVFAFVAVFTLFPAFLSILPKHTSASANDFTAKITMGFARITQRRYRAIFLLGLALLAASAVGISKLEVENRFIDYFHEDTEIHQGMLEIDRKLGGTTPLDIIVRAKAEPEPAESGAFEEEDIFEQYLDDASATASYWLSPINLEKLKHIHDFLDQQPEIGKVMSLATLVRLAEMLNNDKPLSDLETPLLGRMLSDDTKPILYDPFISDDGNEVRINMRVIDSDKELKRAELIERVNNGMRELGYQDEEFQTTGLLVLYNNMLQSLYTSQILTIGIVFLAILTMFAILFRSLSLAAIAIFPNALAASLMLGFMGWRGIPLDMMTITIAAISIGIAVDNTIHYIIRFKREFAKDRDCFAAIDRCHRSIGKAMYYTSMTIILGFSILTLSNFIPTIYFGLLTGIAMLMALLASLSLLPSLLIMFKPIAGAPRHNIADRGAEYK